MLQLAENTDLVAAVELGPARVLRGGERDVEVRLEDGRHVPAIVALALPYTSVEDDVVLVLGKGDRHYVVGVIDGSGKTSLRFRGDVELAARGGTLTLEADEGVEVRSAKVSLKARDLEFVAQSLVQRLHSAYQRVHGLLRTHAERTHTTVDETAVAQARAATIVTEETIHINGEQIHLG